MQFTFKIIQLCCFLCQSFLFVVIYSTAFIFQLNDKLPGTAETLTLWNTLEGSLLLRQSTRTLHLQSGCIFVLRSNPSPPPHSVNKCIVFNGHFYSSRVLRSEYLTVSQKEGTNHNVFLYFRVYFCYVS